MTIDPEVLEKEEKRIPDQNPPLKEPATASLPGENEGEPRIEAPIEPEPDRSPGAPAPGEETEEKI